MGLVLRLMRFIQRKTHIGARTLVHASAAGKESHGKYLSDCRVYPLNPVERADLKDEAEVLQGRVWEELVRKLERLEPGVTRVI